MTMKALLIGGDPFNINLIYEKLRRHGRYGGSTNPPLIFALTGIDNALYDIVGKALLKVEDLEAREQGMREDAAAGMSFDDAYKKWGRA